jgi:hypothetical protein
VLIVKKSEYKSLKARIISVKRFELFVGWLLMIYLIIVGLGAVSIIIINFPTLEDSKVIFPHLNGNKPIFPPFGTIGSPATGLLLLSFFSGVTGSFLHAAQSLGTYIGNAAFKLSWTMWYLLRPWIGGILGFAIYFTFRAGLLGSADAVNPYGLVAVGILGGWFSKVTTDKLEEVFGTLFKTDGDEKRNDKL